MYDAGDCSFDGADGANIPVDVWLSLTSEDDENREKGRWCLHAANYMPRKDEISSDAYRVYSDNKEELDAIVREKILPLYKRAVYHLENMSSLPTQGSLYYWD